LSCIPACFWIQLEFFVFLSIKEADFSLILKVQLRECPGIVFEDPVFKDVLVPVLSEYPLESPTLYIVYASRKYLPLKIRAFIDFLFETIPQKPVAKPPLHSVGGSVTDRDDSPMVAPGRRMQS